MDRICYVSMPFGNTDDKTKYYGSVFEKIIRPAAEKAGFSEKQVVIDNKRGGPIMNHVVENICRAQIVIVDLSDNRPNVYYEAGVTHSFNKNSTVLIKEKSTKVDFDLDGHRVILYDASITGIDASVENITEAILERLDQANSGESDNLIHILHPELPDHLTEYFKKLTAEQDKVQEENEYLKQENEKLRCRIQQMEQKMKPTNSDAAQPGSVTGENERRERDDISRKLQEQISELAQKVQKMENEGTKKDISADAADVKTPISGEKPKKDASADIAEVKTLISEESKEKALQQRAESSQWDIPKHEDRAVQGQTLVKRWLGEPEAIWDLREALKNGRREVTLGRYPQTADGSVRPIQWQVLGHDLTGNGILLISKYILDCKRYNEDKKSGIVWENCDLRRWLTESFIKAFDDAEQQYILSVKNENNVIGKDCGGSSTEDRIFLLSKEEAEIYLSENKSRECKVTRFAWRQGAYSWKGNSNGYWWLRNVGMLSERAMYVRNLGSIYTDGRDINSNDIGVRPALWLDTGRLNFTDR